MDGAGDECHGEDEVHTGRAMKDDGHEDHRALASIYDGKSDPYIRPCITIRNIVRNRDDLTRQPQPYTLFPFQLRAHKPYYH